MLFIYQDFKISFYQFQGLRVFPCITGKIIPTFSASLIPTPTELENDHHAQKYFQDLSTEDQCENDDDPEKRV